MCPAAAARGGRYYDGSSDDYTRRYDRATVVDTAVIAVASASAVRPAMPTSAATAGDRNGDPGLHFVERCLWHGLSCSKTKDANAENNEERINSFHLFLL